ncbi:unnamed protein product [Somion occarium]|uniref:DUF6593 domain-containing protein n=1 Tax=Somion occarium TaxID=3059160 RepID=A0ABP1CWK3_9APHY
MIVTESEFEYNQGPPEEAQQNESAQSVQPSPSTGMLEPPSYIDVIGTRSSASRRHPGHSRDRSQAPSTSHASAGGASGSAQDHWNSAAQGPITYKFVTQSFNSMLLKYEPADLPLYHISTYMNCFIPSSYITVIRRGDSEAGDFVGQFEMGISVKKSTIMIGGKEKVTDAVLSKNQHKAVRTWLWRWHNDENTHLSWTYDSPVKYCYRRAKPGSPEPPLLASYTPPPLVPRDGRPSPAPSLKVYPDGQPLFDHILVSALVIERKRLTPSSAGPLMSWSV